MSRPPVFIPTGRCPMSSGPVACNRAAVQRGLQRSRRVCLGESTADDDPVRALRPFDVDVLGSAAADRCHCRRHGRGTGPAGVHGLRPTGRGPGQRRAVRSPAARSGVRGPGVRASGRGRAGGHRRAARRNGDRPPRRQWERRVHRARSDARDHGGARVPRGPPRPPRLDRGLLLAGDPGGVHHRGRDRVGPRPARQAGRHLQRRGRGHPRDARHLPPRRRRQRGHGHRRRPGPGAPARGRQDQQADPRRTPSRGPGHRRVLGT